MDFGNGWNPTDGQTRRLRVLQWLSDQTGAEPGRYVQLPPLVAVHGEAVVGADIAALEQERLVESVDAPEEALAPPLAALTGTGVEALEALRRAREDPLRRRPAARDAVLRWLYDCKASGNLSPVLHEFSASRFARFYGEPFTDSDVADASVWLRRSSYLRGGESSGAGVPRPEITPAGEQLVERGRSVNDPTTPGSVSIVNTFTNSPGAVAATQHQSPDANQTVTMALQARQEIAQLADYLEQAAPRMQLPPERAAAVAGLVTELRTHSSGEKPVVRRRMLAVLDAVRQIGFAGAGSAFGSVLPQLVDHLVHTLSLG